MKQQISKWTYLEARGCKARIAFGQNTFHAQEESLLNFDRMRATIVAISRRMLHAIRTANGRVRLSKLLV